MKTCLVDPQEHRPVLRRWAVLREHHHPWESLPERVDHRVATRWQAALAEPLQAEGHQEEPRRWVVLRLGAEACNR